MFGIGLVVECGHFCCQRWEMCRLVCCKWTYDQCLSCCFCVWLCPTFCCSQVEPSRSKEKMNWILASTCIAPIVCFGSHIGFVVLAWLADPKHAGAVSVIYIFMFFYYYVTLKAFYQLLIDGKAGCLTCCQYVRVPQNHCCFRCCKCLLKFNQHHQILTLDSPEKEIENREKVFPDTHISFWAILLTGIFDMLLASLQVYSIASLVLLPLIGVIEDTPNYILSLFRVAVFFLTAVITYTVLTAEEPVEKELVKNVVRNFYYYIKKHKTPTAEMRPDKPDRADIVQKVGNIVGALAYKHLSSHVVINMDADDNSDDDLLHPQ